MILKGKIVHSLGIASRTIAEQKPYFRGVLPDVDRLRNGTINILLEHPVGAIVRFDFYEKPIRWDKRAPGLWEDFIFIKIHELVVAGRHYPDWGYMYFPSHSPNRENHRLVELLGMGIKARAGEEVEVHIADGYLKR